MDANEFPESSPETAAEASQQLHKLSNRLTETRRTAARLRAAQDDAEALYKGQRWRALAGGVEGRNADEREANAMTLALTSDAKVKATDIAGRANMPGWTPDTLDDLRWLRDRAVGIAEAASAAAYDCRGLVQSWTSVVSWAKSEYEQTFRGPS